MYTFNYTYRKTVIHFQWVEISIVHLNLTYYKFCNSIYIGDENLSTLVDKRVG